MYKEIYTIPFQSINETNYKVIIEKKNYNGQSTELIGGSSPFVVDVNIENPFSPFRLSTGTLRIFGSDYLQSLFTPDPQGVRVKLMKNNQIEWLGFISNDVYSQDYSNEEFIYEVEVINPISTLKYKKFKKNDRGLVSIINLITEALLETNSELHKFYLPATLTNTANSVIYDQIMILADNFVDEEDEPMSYYDILQEIAKFLNFTITINKNDIFFIDYIGIGKNHNTYEQYNISGTTIAGLVTFSDTKTVQNIDYFGDSFRLNINSGKNKGRVNCSLYDVDEVIPKFDDEKSQYLGHTIYTYKKKKQKDKHMVIRYYHQPKFDLYSYMWGNNGWMESINVTLGNRPGTRFVRTANFENNKPASLSFTNELMTLIQHKEGSDTKFLDGNCKIASFKSNKYFVASKDVHFILNLSLKFNREIQDEEDQIWKTNNDTSRITVPVSLKIGDYYYNGTNWTLTPSKFEPTIHIEKNTWLEKTYFSLENKNDYESGLGDKEGWVINSPNFTIYGKPELTIYYNHFTSAPYEGSNEAKKIMGIKYEFMKDISLDYIIKDDSNIFNDWEEDNNDVVYENVINSDYVEDLESEVDLNICTFPDKYTKIPRATVYTNNDFLIGMKYQPLNKFDRIEHLTIEKMVNYYTNPKFQIDMTLNNVELKPYTIVTDSNLPNKKFINAGNSIDYEFEKNTINLIEI